MQTRVETRELGTQTFDVFDKGINGICSSDGLCGLGRTLPELSNAESLGSRGSGSFTNVLDKVSDVLSLIVQRGPLVVRETLTEMCLTASNRNP